MPSFADRYKNYTGEQVIIMNDFVKNYGRGFSFEPVTGAVDERVQG